MTLTAGQQRLVGDQTALTALLEQAGARFKGRTCTCPFHNDQHPSAGIYQGQDGAWRFKCQVCGTGGGLFDIRARLNNSTPAAELKSARGDDDAPPPLPLRTSTTPPPVPAAFPDVAAIQSRFPGIVATYTYSNPKIGKPDMIVFRREGADGKSFLQAHMTDRGVVLQAPPKPWPVYNRVRVEKNSVIVVVEGEKCVHRLHEAGFVATTSPGGAGKAGLADWTPLAGKRVYLWPDNDPVDKNNVRRGIAHMRDVAKILEGLNPAPTVHWIDPDSLGLPTKGDCVEFCAKFSAGDELTEALAMVLAKAEPLGASAEVRALMADIFSGKRRTIGWPWPIIGKRTRAIQPGTITLLCGDGGAAKSFMLLEALSHWHDQVGGRLSLLAMEDGRAYHLRRALAQRVGESRLTDDEWVKENRMAVEQMESDHREHLNALGRIIHEPPLEGLAMRQAAEWVSARCEAGDKIICIDPITAAIAGERSWLDDQQFMLAVKPDLVRHEAALVLVTHPKKSGKSRFASMDDIAGGACWPRLSQTVLWLKLDPPDKTYEIQTPLGKVDMEGNRTLNVLKARNAPGGEGRIAFRLESDSLRMTELGMIAGKVKKGGGDW